MPKYVEFPLDGGGSILIESPDDPPRSPSGFVKGGGADAARELVDPGRQSFDESVENVRRSADLLISKLRALSHPPDEMEVVFNLKASSELASLAVGRAGAECNYAVTLRWRKEVKDERESRKESGEHAAAAE